MFDHFAADDVIIGCIEQPAIRKKERVILHNTIAFFLKHFGNNGTGTRAEIQTDSLPVISFENCIRDGKDELPVSGVMHVVVMFEIPFLFPLGRQMKFVESEDAPAGIALKELIRFHRIGAMFAQGANLPGDFCRCCFE